MKYKNYEVLYIGYGDADRLAVLSVSEELFERHVNCDGQWN